jgi:protease PrsW
MALLAYLPSVMGAAAILPAAMFLWIIVASDRRAEPLGLAMLAFLAGIAAIFISRQIIPLILPVVHLAGQPWGTVLARAMLVAAMPEEAVKVAIIAALVLRLRHVHEPMDGVVFGVAVGLGCAAWENLGYLAHDPVD